jgi:type II secretory pathway pseudopilin PulG
MAARGAAQRGFTYIGLLLLVAIIGFALAAAGVVWHTQAQREREQELLFIGHQFQAAIRSYYVSKSGGTMRYPQSLDDLLHDERGPEPKHHLRKLYLDPMTGAADWTLLQVDGVGITGIASSAKGKPIKQTGFAAADSTFADADCYCDWKFSFQPGLRARRAVIH